MEAYLAKYVAFKCDVFKSMSKYEVITFPGV